MLIWIPVNLDLSPRKPKWQKKEKRDLMFPEYLCKMFFWKVKEFSWSLEIGNPSGRSFNF
jgi:hypothetical protein